MLLFVTQQQQAYCLRRLLSSISNSTSAVTEMGDQENPLDGDHVVKEEAKASNSHSAVPESQNGPESSSNKEDASKSKEGGTQTVPFFKLFSFADSLDYLLMSVGTIGAIGNGICMPLMTIILGDVINSFGESANSNKVVDTVSKVRICH